MRQILARGPCGGCRQAAGCGQRRRGRHPQLQRPPEGRVDAIGRARPAADTARRQGNCHRAGADPAPRGAPPFRHCATMVRSDAGRALPARRFRASAASTCPASPRRSTRRLPRAARSLQGWPASHAATSARPPQPPMARRLVVQHIDRSPACPLAPPPTPPPDPPAADRAETTPAPARSSPAPLNHRALATLPDENLACALAKSGAHAYGA
jgi:hypothetical protein